MQETCRVCMHLHIYLHPTVLSRVSERLWRGYQCVDTSLYLSVYYTTRTHFLSLRQSFFGSKDSAFYLLIFTWTKVQIMPVF